MKSPTNTPRRTPAGGPTYLPTCMRKDGYPKRIFPTYEDALDNGHGIPYACPEHGYHVTSDEASE